MKKPRVIVFLISYCLVFWVGMSIGSTDAKDKIERLESELAKSKRALANATASNDDLRATLTNTNNASESNAQTPPATSEIQERRKKLIQELIDRDIILKVECIGTIPKLWVQPAFYALNYDDKNSFCGVVAAYYYPDTPQDCYLVLKDSQTGNEVGTYAAVTNGLKMK